MPSIYSKYISTRDARERSLAGLSRLIQTNRSNNNSHPSFGGSHGYPLWYRCDIMFWFNIFGMEYVINCFTFSRATIFRWRNRLEPYQQTGNKEKGNLTGFDQLLLVMALFIFPRSKTDEFAMFITVNGGLPGLSRQAISSWLDELNITIVRWSKK